MTKSKINVICFLCFLVALAGCSKSGLNSAEEPALSQPNLTDSKRIGSLDVVRVAAARTQINAGGSGEVDVHLLIQPGYHINANPPTYPYLKATELEIAPSEGVSVGLVTYPPPANKKFPFAEKPLAVYEGETDLKATLKADSSAKQGDRSISARLRVQACDDQVCYPPGTLDLTIPVTIK